MNNLRVLCLGMIVACIGCGPTINEDIKPREASEERTPSPGTGVATMNEVTTPQQCVFGLAEEIRKAILMHEFEDKVFVLDRLSTELAEHEVEARSDGIIFRGIFYDRRKHRATITFLGESVLLEFDFTFGDSRPLKVSRVDVRRGRIEPKQTTEKREEH